MAGQLRVRSRDAGFTLIELLVVITILSVLSVGGAMLMTRPGPDSDPDSGDLAAFRAAHDRLRSLAVHGNGLRGLYVTPRGRRMADLQDGRWQTSGPELRWRAALRIDPVRRRTLSPPEAADGFGAPQILYYPDGHSTPFEARFGAGRDQIRCRSDGWTGLKCDTP